MIAELFTSCLEKQHKIVDLFKGCSSQEEIYSKIIELGKKCPKLANVCKTDSARVLGCQSQMFIHTYVKDNKIYFEVEADALISQGLAFLLTSVYSDELKESILRCPPKHIEALGLMRILTPSRANGIFALYKRMQEEARILG